MSKNSRLVSERRRTLKKMVVEYLGGKCVRCGWSGHHAALVPHHVNPSKKNFSLGSGNSYKWSTLMDECKKCLLLCHNCHAIVHAEKEPFFFDESNIPLYQSVEDPKAKGVAKNNLCFDCGVVISYMAKRCQKCCAKHNAKAQYKIDWPSQDILAQMVKDLGFSGASKKLGVSDNSVRKHLRNYSQVADVG